jgi:hypothetical protein
MANDIPQEELLRYLSQVLKCVEQSGKLAAIEDRDDWDTLVESQTDEQRELLQELARFTDLWRYLQEHNQKLGREIVDAIAQVHRLPILQRISELRTINHKLMHRVSDTHQHPQLRH